MKLTKEIIYPIFIQVSTYCKDNFWKQLYIDMAYGHFPFGVSVYKDRVFCSFKDKKFNYTCKDDPEDIHRSLTDLFKTKLGILSSIDILQKRQNFQLLLYENFDDWKNIKKKNIRDLLIEKYALKLKDQYNLPINKVRRIIKKIILGFYFKLISNTDILYDAEQGIMDIQMNNMTIVKYTKPKDHVHYKKTMSDQWLKYNKLD